MGSCAFASAQLPKVLGEFGFAGLPVLGLKGFLAFVSFPAMGCARHGAQP
jgi:hypothetical protein